MRAANGPGVRPVLAVAVGFSWLQRGGATGAQQYSLEGQLGFLCPSGAHEYDELCHTTRLLPACPSLSPLCSRLHRGFQGTADFCAERK